MEIKQKTHRQQRAPLLILLFKDSAEVFLLMGSQKKLTKELQLFNKIQVENECEK
jgi:hypothetical protein